MKEYDIVELIVEKDCYAKKGVHKGMDGWICDERIIDGCRLVCFDQYGALPNIATISVREEDLKVTVSHVDSEYYKEWLKQQELNNKRK